jgi:hypothetical protein
MNEGIGSYFIIVPLGLRVLSMVDVVLLRIRVNVDVLVPANGYDVPAVETPSNRFQSLKFAPTDSCSSPHK